MSSRFESATGVVREMPLVVRWYRGRDRARILTPERKAWTIVPQGPLVWEPVRWNELSEPVGRLAPWGPHDLRALSLQEQRERWSTWVFRPDLAALVAQWDQQKESARAQLAMEIAFADDSEHLTAARIAAVMEDLFGPVPT